MVTQTLGDVAGYIKAIIGSSPDWKNYTNERKVKVATQVGEFITSAGETAGDPWDLGAAGDELTGGIEYVYERVGAKSQDIDTEIAIGSYVKTLRYSGGRFKLIGWRQDESTSLLDGQLMKLGTAGRLIAQTYADTAEATDMVYFPQLRLAKASADVAGEDCAIEFYW